MTRKAVFVVLAGLAMALLPGTGECQKEKVFRTVSNQQLEEILKGMKIEYKKVPGKKDGVFFFDFERNKLKISLHNYDGKDLAMDAIFPQISLEEINRWNQGAKFSRAVLFKSADEDRTSLESQLDCVGGVTSGMIRQFIFRFDEELKKFGTLLKK